MGHGRTGPQLVNKAGLNVVFNRISCSGSCAYNPVEVSAGLSDDVLLNHTIS